MNDEDDPISFIGQYKLYHRYSTDAPPQYGVVISIQILGHALGYETVNLIQPKAVHHNIYGVLVGKSTVSRKTTSEDIGDDTYPTDRKMLNSSSPERFLEELSDNPERFQFLGEFSYLLKGINSRGSYMSPFMELYDDFHGCPENYKRGLTTRKGKKSTYVIGNAYLSVASTITPEVLRERLTLELIEGGFLPRWFIVFGEGNPKRRERLRSDHLKLKTSLKNLVTQIVGLERDIVFLLDDEALDLYNLIEQDCYTRYDRVLPFVGRYMNYMIAFADIIAVSDAVGCMTGKNDGNEVTSLSQLLKLNNDTRIEVGDKKDDNTKVWIPKQYIDRAWQIIEPSLDYVTTLTDYIELGIPVAKLTEYMRKHKTATHSDAMRNCRLDKDKMRLAVDTLEERSELEEETKQRYRANGSEVDYKVYHWIGK
jgi:hypothetical protein